MRGAGPLTENQQEDIMLSSLMQRLNERRAAEFELEGSADAGFTLIELMVVLLILAILLAIAIPTFLGVTGSANDRAAQSNLNTALTNAKSIYEQQNQSYPTGTVTTTSCASLATNVAIAVTIQCNEPSLSMLTTTPGGTVTPGQAGALASTDGNGAVVYALAKNTKECWWVADNPAPINPANTPWLTAITAGIPASGAGIPTSQGVFYGVFKTTSTAAAAVGSCSAAGIAGATSNMATPGFPAAQ
jgi:prepilin-type N-terminal cleavage/methylation domain-containing protein